MRRRLRRKGLAISNTKRFFAFADDNVRTIAYTKGWLISNGKMSKKKAKSITSISGVFKGANSIKTFNEAKYFTSCESFTDSNAGDYIFEGCTSLEEITLPNTATALRDNAFYNCSALTSINFPASLTKLGNQVFSGCTSLALSVFPESIESMGGGVFNNTKVSFTTMGSKVEVLNVNAFSACLQLTNVTLPTSLKTLVDTSGENYGVFKGCTNLEKVVFPDTLQTLGGYCFYQCTNLDPDSLSFPNVTYIGNYVFVGTKCGTTCKKLDIPKCTQVGGAAFHSAGITEINAPELVKTTAMGGNGAFMKCTSLQKAYVPKMVNVGDSAFAYCSALSDLTIGDEVLTVGSKAFLECSNLPTINLPKCTSIGASAFELCSTEVSASFSIPVSVQNIGSNAFLKSGLNITWVDGSNITEIGQQAFDQCTSAEFTAPALPKITLVNSYTFRSTNLKGTFSASEVTAVNDGAFLGCAKLEGVNMPKLTHVGASAFSGCSALESLNVGTLTYIGSYAFSGCTNANLNFTQELIDGVTTWGDRVFDGVYERTGTKLKLVLQSGRTYGDQVLSDTSWTSKFAMIHVLDTGELTTVPGAGLSSQCKTVIIRKVIESMVWYNLGRNWGGNLAVIFEEGNCNKIDLGGRVLQYIGVAHQTLGLGLRDITGNYTNYGLLNTYHLIYRSSYQEMYATKGTFFYQAEIDKAIASGISIPTRVYAIGSAEWVTVMKQYATLEGWGSDEEGWSGVFADPDYDWTEEYCDYDIYGVERPEKDASGVYKTWLNKNLTTLSVTSGITAIAESEYEDWTNLSSCTIASTVTSIGASAFKNCTSLTAITFSGTQSAWNAITFGDDWHSGSALTTIHCTDGDITL